MTSGTLNWHEVCLQAKADEAFVLVTVFRVRGSSPREEGAKMLVSSTDVQGTIGGGHLEFQAIQKAQIFLADQQTTGFLITEAPLTPRFDQCCGGQVTLVFEKIMPQSIQQSTHWLSALENAVSATKICQAGGSGDLPTMGLVTEKYSQNGEQSFQRYVLSEEAFNEQSKQDQANSLFEPIEASAAFKIVLFGAGHVGKALVQSLGHLDVAITWVDSRDEMFPTALPAYLSDKVTCLQTNDWASVIRNAAEDSYFLVMSYSHQLDFALTEAILAKGAFAYFGLIGSAKKRQRFEQQLLKTARQGSLLTASDLNRMTCPIGLPSIQGKSPEVIAASVTAQLLEVFSSKLAVFHSNDFSSKLSFKR